MIPHVGFSVATTPTVYGIETSALIPISKVNTRVATTPTVYGIETFNSFFTAVSVDNFVATTPTVYGIETQRELL